MLAHWLLQTLGPTLQFRLCLCTYCINIQKHGSSHGSRCFMQVTRDRLISYVLLCIIYSYNMIHVLYHRFLSKHATHAPGFTKDTYFILFLCNSSNRHWHEFRSSWDTRLSCILDRLLREYLDHPYESQPSLWYSGVADHLELGIHP